MKAKNRPLYFFVVGWFRFSIAVNKYKRIEYPATVVLHWG